MNQTLDKLYNLQLHFQTTLFPHIKQELVHLTQLQQKFIEALEISQIDSHVPYIGQGKCRPTKSRIALARAFIAKAVNKLIRQLIRELIRELIRDRHSINIFLHPNQKFATDNF